MVPSSWTTPLLYRKRNFLVTLGGAHGELFIHRQVVHFGAEKLNLLLCFFASTSHHLEVRESEFLTFTFLKPFQFGVVFTPLFPEAIELTSTQDERIEMEHPSSSLSLFMSSLAHPQSLRWSSASFFREPRASPQPSHINSSIRSG